MVSTKYVYLFFFNIESLLGLGKMLLFGPSPVKQFLLTYKLSQDHLELFFSAVRQFGGWNNNPSAIQFSNDFRSLLSHVPSVSVIKIVKHCEVIMCSCVNIKKVYLGNGRDCWSLGCY